MKLYTEEQVRQAIKMADKYHHVLDSEENEIVSILEPIELPSDDQIYTFAFRPATEYFDDYHDESFINGAEWMREQILKNK